MRKKIAALSLSLAMLVNILYTPAYGADGSAAGGTSQNIAAHWFYDQLSWQGQAIYDAIAEMYGSGMMQDGQTSYDLIAKGVVGKSVVENYLDGNRTLFNDFAAAKDAFDLEHPEAWYFDSSELSFRVTSEANGTLHAYMGPGKTADYYITGVTGAAEVRSKTSALAEAVRAIVSGAQGKSTDYEKVRYVHGQITHSISYRFETECREENIGYLRTAYALVTHEGVCEGYARSFQYVLNELNIPCVLIHGVQTSGEPEAHMWCAVRLSGAWYVVDPTWDDPVGLDAAGNIKATGKDGDDGYENEKYLLVGQNVVGANWQPSGYVSSSVTAFGYPEIALMSYGSGVLEQNGLKVEYANDTMEGGASTVYHVSFNGDGLVEAAKKGYYFLVKMYDLNADGSVYQFDDWYYSVHGLHSVQSSFDPDNNFQASSNPYFGDTREYLVYNVINCEYVEFAVTTKAPPRWETADDLFTMGGYYSGDYSDILAETGLIFNANGGYEQTPYVKNASPALSAPVTAGQRYTIHLEFTDPLYHPNQNSIDNAVSGKVNQASEAMAQAVALDYRGTTYSWGVNARQPHTFASKPEPQNVRWVCETHGTHEGFDKIGAGCRLTTLEYEFTSSSMWADDSCQYEFYLTGLVGVKSNKFPMSWSYVFENKYPFWTCPLYSGYTWNLWAQPQILDNPADLDFNELVVKGVDGKEQSLAELYKSMNLDPNDMNGRIVMTVQNIGESGSKTEELAQAISDSKDINVPAEAVLGSSLYEIDFARICRCTIVRTGQSLRLCVGFPPGIDASMAGVVFKAYHFTRDIEGSCEITNEGHVHTGEITSVEEIPITVTPYGLVITCSKFSPFEIVALDAGKAGIQAGEQHAAVLVSDGYGKVLVDGAVGSGIVEFDKNRTHTFTAAPDEGYVLDTVTFGGGKVIEVVNNLFTLSYDDFSEGSTVVSVSFVPASVKAVEEAAGETVAAPAVCNHEHTRGIAYKAASCTENGHTSGLVCTDCGMTLSESSVIRATGHKYVDGVCAYCGGKEPGNDPGTGGGSGTATPGEPATPGASDQPVNGASGFARGGSWLTDVSAAKKGDTVFVTSRANRGYISAAPAVWDKDGNSVAVTRNKDGTYSFTMPEGGVTVTGSYVTPDQLFSDMVDGAWYLEDIAYAVENGLMEGMGDNLFSPGATTTRGMIVTILYRLEGEPAVTRSGFTDVAPEQWYADAVAWAADNKIVEGYGDNLFGPTDNILREQAAVILYRYAVYKGYDVSGQSNLSGYTDTGTISDWALTAMRWANSEGLITGRSTIPPTLEPEATATRAEAAAILSRFCRDVAGLE